MANFVSPQIAATTGGAHERPAAGTNNGATKGEGQAGHDHGGDSDGEHTFTVVYGSARRTSPSTCSTVT